MQLNQTSLAMAQKNAPLLQSIRHLFADGFNVATGAVDKIVAYAESGATDEDISYAKISEKYIDNMLENGYVSDRYFAHSAIQNAVLGLDASASVLLALKYENK